MKLDVKSLVNAPLGESESFSIELFKEKVDEEIVADRIRGNLNLTRLEDEILAQFEGSAKVISTCDRCAGDMTLDLPLKFSQEYVIDRNSADVERLFVSNHFEIEFLEPLRQEIIAAIPVKKCGKNLNDGPCDCK
jgi:uncharacterized metal-binding protein YceD (DUF177 family)